MLAAGLTCNGRLVHSSGQPVAGPLDLSVTFHDADSGGSQKGPVYSISSVTLTDGIFSITINFASGDANTVLGGVANTWIQITDVTNGVVYPRQRLDSMPFAARIPIDNLTVSYDADGKLQVVGLAGRSLPAGEPLVGQVLKWQGNATGWVWADDLTGGDPGSVTAAEIADGTISDADISAAAGITDDKLATITTAGKVANSATSAAATNDANTIVSRDGSGDFSAGTITATLNGNAATATTADNLSSVVGVSEGGIGASSAADARTNLGLGALSTMNSIGSAEISNGTIADADISSAAAISDTKFAMINTAGKVSGNAITSGIIGGSAAIDSSGQLATTGGMVLKPDGGSATATQFFDDAGDNYVALKSPAVVSADKTYVLPAADGSDGDLLKTDGSGNLSWVGIGGASLAVENKSSDFTLTGGDINKIFVVSGDTTATLPSLASVAAGYSVTLKRNDPANSILIQPAGSDAIDGSNFGAVMYSNYASVKLVANATAWFMMYSSDVKVNKGNPATPSNFTATPAKDEITLNWDSVASAEGYLLVKGIGSAVGFSPVD